MGDSFLLGNEMRIEWRSENISGDVSIIMSEAYPRKYPILSYKIESAYPNDDSPYTWKIPESVLEREYFIEIRQGELYGKSGIFKIAR